MKVAIHVDDLPLVRKGLKLFRHKRNYAIDLMNHFDADPLPKLIPKHITAERLFESSAGIHNVPFGSRKGIHTSGTGGAVNYLRNFMTKSPPKTPAGQKAFNNLILAHEGIEKSVANKIMPKALRDNYDAFRGKQINQMAGAIFPTSRRVKYPKPSSRKALNKAVKDLEGNAWSSHYSPDVMLQEGNILATLRGKGSREASSALRNLRNTTGEAAAIEDVAKKLGYKGFKYGKTRINRSERKAFVKMLKETNGI